MCTKKQTEKSPWHQRLGHPCDKHLCNASKAINGVPKFMSIASALDACPTCVRSKQTKARKQPDNTAKSDTNSSKPGTVNPHSTKRALHPHQGLSIDFSFAGLTSKNSNRRVDFEGIDGETAWTSVTNHFSGVMHGDAGISKAAPALWLKHFPAQCNPPCKDECVCMDQGSELFNNPEVENLFTKLGCAVHPTGADASDQNGPASDRCRCV